jgi:hypothetical protein
MSEKTYASTLVDSLNQNLNPLEAVETPSISYVTHRRTPLACTYDNSIKCNPYVTNRSGYIPARQQIENFQAAGRRIDDYRDSIYSNIPEEINTIDYGMDFFDAMDSLKHLKLQQRKIQLRNEQAKKDREERDAEVERNKDIYNAARRSPSEIPIPDTPKSEGVKE